MSTQAVVSVRQGGVMSMKFVVGCNGMEADSFVAALKALGRVPSPAEGLEMATTHNLGCDGCLVLVTPTEIICEDIGDEALDLYRKTFNDPAFNPRWENGTAAYTRIVDF